MIKTLNAVLKGIMYGMIIWPIATLLCYRLRWNLIENWKSESSS